jgi:hypothetical protein
LGLILFVIIIVIAFYVSWVEKKNKIKNESLNYDFRRLALCLRRIQLGILMMLLTSVLFGGLFLVHFLYPLFITGLVMDRLLIILAVPQLCFVIWMIPSIFSLADFWLTGCLLILYWLLVGFMPFFNVFFLLWLIGDANKTLTGAGYKVGFLGVDMEQFQQAEMLRSEQTEP